MKPIAKTALASALALLCAAVLATPADASFGLKNVDMTFTGPDGSPSMQAGSHPFALDTTLDLTTHLDPETSKEVLDGELRDVVASFPPGFIGDQTTAPRCSYVDFLTDAIGSLEPDIPHCSPSSQVGIARVGFGPGDEGTHSAVFNLPPAPGSVARFGFHVEGVPVTVDITVNADPPYNLIATVPGIPQIIPIFNSELTTWGVPADPAHDAKRYNCPGGGIGCPAGIPERPLITLPRRCNGPLSATIKADSWQEPGIWFEEALLTHDDSIPPNPLGTTGCSKLGYAPRVTSQPTAISAESGSGLDFDLDFEDEGLKNPEGLAQSETKKVEVAFPEGVTINPSVGESLGVCTPAELGRETPNSAPGEGCPNASKLGSLEVKTPLAEEPIEGSIFLAPQDDPKTTTPGAENPFDSLITLYFVLKNPTLGVNLKVPVKVEPDPKTGRLVASLDDIPQYPFSHFNAHLRTGARAALVTPPHCGSYTTEAKLYPWSAPSTPLTVTSSFQITSGVGGGACPPGGVPPFKPEYEAGSLNNNAKSYSPFYMRLIRHDGEQDMTKFSSVLPPGVLGKLAGVGKCPDAAIAVAKAKTGREELVSPSCPASSQIGRSLAGAGVGGALTYVSGSIYLGGPYHGDPLSVIAITPAVAGPFDAGTVVVREALTLNPETAEVEVDGAASDPIPHILKGIVLKVRDLRVYVDRNDFIINPTSCDESSAKATLFGGYLDVFSSADDVPVGLSTRYQAANCLNLPFKPRLSLKLNGGTRRGDHPALKAILNANPADANIGKAVVTLAKSSFLDQAHIRTICTRVQFAAKACPKGAEYGYARAWTPLLEEPVEGPVYLRSSNHKLPDLVAALHGLVDVNVVGRIDSKNGAIRSSFETVPDAPVTKFVLTMQGGNKGLVVNSRSLCAKPSYANAQFTGQNGVPHNFHPLVKASCGGKRKK